MQINEIELLGLDIPLDTTEMIVADTDKILYSIPIGESLKQVLLAKTESNTNFISNAFGTAPYVAIPQLFLTLQANTKYQIDVMLIISTLGDVSIPFAIKVATSEAWTGKMFGTPTAQILCNDSYTDTVVQDLNADGAYITNSTYVITRALIHISGYIITGSDVTNNLEIYCKNTLANDGDSFIIINAGSYMRLLPVVEQV